MRRSFLPVALAGLLSACGAGDHAPVSETTPPPGLAERFYPPEGWAWGLVEPSGGAPQRYGVSGPAAVVRGDILVLPDYGETAETWFETAHDLNSRGYAVWVLDGPGQGGSGREVLPRDLGYARSLSAGAAAVRKMIQAVIRSEPPRRLVVVGQGAGATVALLAIEGMKRQPDGLVLDSPGPAPAAGRPRVSNAFERWSGLDLARAPGGQAWSRDSADDFGHSRTHDRWRGGVTLAWQRANPGLRMGGASRAWVDTLAQARAEAAAGANRVRAPVLVLNGVCAGLPRCAAIEFPGAGPALELESDAIRDVWLNAVAAAAAHPGAGATR